MTLLEYLIFFQRMSRQLGDFIWSQISKEDYDVMIVCDNGVVKSNKCFSVFYEEELFLCYEIFCSIWSEHEQDVVFMPEYKVIDVYHLTGGFSMMFPEEPDQVGSFHSSPQTHDDVIEELENESFREAMPIQIHSKIRIQNLTARENDTGVFNQTKPTISTSRCCHLCGASFPTAQKIAQHIYYCHPKDNYKFECSVCLGMGSLSNILIN